MKPIRPIVMQAPNLEWMFARRTRYGRKSGRNATMAAEMAVIPGTVCESSDLRLATMCPLRLTAAGHQADMLF